MRAGAADGDAQVVEGPMENYATLRDTGDERLIATVVHRSLRRILSCVGTMYTRSTPARPS